MAFMQELTNIMRLAFNLNIKRSTHLQDHIQGGPKKLAHYVLYALT